MAERVLLAIVTFRKGHDWPIKDLADELNDLVISCGGQVEDIVFCKNIDPNPSFLIGEGKVKDIAQICLQKDIDAVIFSEDLKGSQQRNLEEALGTKTIDRTELILDIFARRATSQEGKMQVELAQLEYLLPRLTGQGVEMSRPGGGIGTLGPGETKLEVDRRKINQRISRLKQDLRAVSQSRKVKRKKRKENKTPTISLIGYTNAGKSTLLNALTGAHQETKDGLFTTLDPLSRHCILENQQNVIFSDTVGFMHRLPHQLIESFKATLEEVQEADLLLHVVDISHPKFRDYHVAVMEVLKELGADTKPILTVLNKIDRLDDHDQINMVADSFQEAICISAKTGEGLDSLRQRIQHLVGESAIDVAVDLPLSRMDLVNLVHQHGHMHSIEYLSDRIRIRATVPPTIAHKLQ